MRPRLLGLACLPLLLSTAALVACSDDDGQPGPPPPGPGYDFTACARDTARGDDGVLEEHTTFSYDANNFLSSQRDDFDLDGVVDRRFDYQYDEAGYLLREAFYADNVTASDVHNYTYDALGHELTSSDDQNGDGVLNRVVLNHYDDAGWITTSEVDSNGDGTFDGTRIHTVDARGFIVLTEIDDGNDGVIDAVATYVRDADGHYTRYEHDDMVDGHIDYSAERKYEAGQLVDERWDTDGDAIVDMSAIYTRRADGMVLTESTSWNTTGTIDSVATFAYACE